MRSRRSRAWSARGLPGGLPGGSPPPRTAEAAPYGTNTPLVAKSVFPGVEIKPSAPPSNTCTFRACQMERLFSTTVPGSIESAVVDALQVEPSVGSLVAAQDNANDSV